MAPVTMKPPVDVENPKTLITSTLLMFVCLVGMCGNVYGITKMRCLVIENGFHRIYLIITLLCFSELCVAITLPMTVVDQLLGFWMFGDVVCRFYSIFGSFGKIVTPLLLAVLSVELAFPHHCLRVHLREYVVAIVSIVFCVLVLPVLIIYGTQDRIYTQYRNQENLVHIVTTKCGILANTNVKLHAAISVVTFALTFILPVCIFAAGQRDVRFRYTNSGTAVHWYWRAANILFMLCWGPLWLLIAFATALEVKGDHVMLNEQFKLVFFVLQGLPLLLTMGLWAIVVPLSLNVHTLHRLAARQSSTRRLPVTRQETEETRSMSVHFDPATSIIRNIKAASVVE